MYDLLLSGGTITTCNNSSILLKMELLVSKTIRYHLLKVKRKYK